MFALKILTPAIPDISGFDNLDLVNIGLWSLAFMQKER